MATINEITSGASYRGDAALGGGLGTGITIDNSPMQRLATFMYYRDRDLWQQKIVEDKAAADQIANIAAFDISSPLKPYTEDLKSELGDIQSFIRENPDALVYSRNPGKFQELNEKINRFRTKRKGATANDVLYNAAKSAAEKIVDPRERDLKLRELSLKADKLFSNGLDNAYNTQLEYAPDLQPSDFEIPTVGLTTRSFIAQLPNSDVITDITYLDVEDGLAKAQLAVAGGPAQVDVNSDWFKRLSPEEQKLELEKNTLTTAQRKNINEISVGFNNALQQWKAANPNVNLSEVDPNTIGSGIIEDNVRSIRNINDQIDQLNAFVLEGKIKDPAGRVRTKPYDKINFEDGLSEAEVALIKSLQNAKTPILSKVDKQIQQTDNAIQGQQLAETTRHNKAMENINAGQLKLEQDKWKSTMTGGETVKNGAMERAKRIYGDLKKLADKNGVISPDKLRRLNQEQLKYLGVEQITQSDAGVSKSVFTPLSFAGDKEYAIQLVNGEIRVLQPKDDGDKLGRTDNGLFTGHWDNSRSTNVFNVATNILNEELSKAGSKELNSYMAIDLGVGGVTSNTSGGSTSVSGGGGKYLIKGKNYTEADLLKLGYTLEQIKPYKQ